MNINPKISVIMAVYNGQEYLKEAINSVLIQTFNDFEFIIIDDCSTDNTHKIIESFNDKRIRYAFCYLYDRQKMNKEMYYNEYGMMNSLYSGSVYENKDNNPFEYNPTEAKKLLKEAGYIERNTNGWLVHSETGKILSFEITK